MDKHEPTNITAPGPSIRPTQSAPFWPEHKCAEKCHSACRTQGGKRKRNQSENRGFHLESGIQIINRCGSTQQEAGFNHSKPEKSTKKWI
jgi:hypothetical protein